MMKVMYFVVILYAAISCAYGCLGCVLVLLIPYKVFVVASVIVVTVIWEVEIEN